jgi:hypothetical protein
MKITMRRFHKLTRSRFAAEANKVVQTEGIKPCFDVFPSLTVLTYVFPQTRLEFRRFRCRHGTRLRSAHSIRISA